MKKLFLLCLLLLLSGCSVVRIDTNNIDNIVDVVLSKNNDLYNQIGKGYKYYIPRGVSYISSNKHNDILYSNGNYYYLYIDIISYYYKVKQEYKINTEAYYSKVINNNGKIGYLEINKIMNDRYLIKFLYNYSKIEVESDYEDINDVVLNISYILSTIKFNDKLIKISLDEDFLKSEEKYEEFTTKKENEDFLKLEEEEK